jgi:hypothetical protein
LVDVAGHAGERIGCVGILEVGRRVDGIAHGLTEGCEGAGDCEHMLRDGGNLVG